MQTCTPHAIVLNPNQTTSGSDETAHSVVALCINRCEIGPENLVLTQDKNILMDHIRLTEVTITQDEGSDYQTFEVQDAVHNLYGALTRQYALCINLCKTGPESLVLTQDKNIRPGHIRLTEVTITRGEGNKHHTLKIQGARIKLDCVLTRFYARTSQNDATDGVGKFVDQETQTENIVAEKKTEESASESFFLKFLMRMFDSCTGPGYFGHVDGVGID